MSARGTPSQMLRDRTARGPVTLFLGAGVSRAQGIPGWSELVHRVRDRAGLPPCPWLWRDVEERERLARALKELRRIDPDLRAELALTVPSPHPQAFPIALEEVEATLRQQFLREAGESEVGAHHYELARRQLEEWVHDALYTHRTEGRATGSLRTIAELLATDRRRASPRIARVITTNADDLLEEELNRGHDYLRAPAAWPICRAGDNPRRRDGADDRPPIAVYHIHGYIPRRSAKDRRGAPDTMVFTDAQYWETVGSPGSFANRVVAGALHDSYCLFVGLSMTDVNLTRWLGLRAVEITEDKLSLAHRKGWSSSTLDSSIRRALLRHAWIRTEADDPTGLVTRHLERRGVGSLVIENWEDGLTGLLEQLFPR